MSEMIIPWGNDGRGGMMRILSCSLSLLMISCTSSVPPGVRTPGPVEATSLFGKPLSPPSLDPETQKDREKKLMEARSAWQRNPKDADAIVWLGRRTAYLGRYLEAIDIFTRGIEIHPGDARLYRHRGHRYITIRRFDLAVVDLEKAASLVVGTRDEVEPDGLPNARNIPTSTLHSNIDYHLGLAYYLQGRFDDALLPYRRDLERASNPDMLVATTHWAYMTLRRLGREDEAAMLLEPISPKMEIIENTSYHKLLLFYRRELTLDDLVGAQGDSIDIATVGYGVGNWHLYNGRRAEAVEMFERVLESEQWAAFGYLACEAELARGRR